MEKFGKFMTVLLVLIISPIIHGFVFTKLWIWFIVPTFNVQPLRLVEAIGIMLTVGYVFAKPTKNNDEKSFWENFAETCVFVVLMALFALAAGWIIKLFM